MVHVYSQAAGGAWACTKLPPFEVCVCVCVCVCARARARVCVRVFACLSTWVPVLVGAPSACLCWHSCVHVQLSMIFPRCTQAVVWRVSWSLTGNVLAVSCGDGKVTLWKEGLDGQWRLIESIHDQ